MLDKIVNSYMNAFDSVFMMLFNTNPLSSDGGQIMIAILIVCAVIYVVCDIILNSLAKKQKGRNIS